MGLKKYLLNRKDDGNDRWLLFKKVGSVVSNWILATGFWNDSGVWDDNSTWID